MAGVPMDRWPRLGRDDGVSLIELLAAMAILGIILTTISLSISETLSTTATSKLTLAGSNLVDFAARYFGPDVQSAPSAPVVLPLPGCGTDTTAVRVPAADGTGHWIAYVKVDDASGTALERRVCDTTGTSVLSKSRLGWVAKPGPTVPGPALTVGAACLPDAATCSTLTMTLTPAGGTSVFLRADRRTS